MRKLGKCVGKITKILIANRGEIACRVIKTAQKLGIKTVAVYSTADSRELHTKLADESFYLGPSPSTHSYLNQKKLLEAIKQTGAEAVHPGYGFLSENPSFVEMLENEEVVFIGPPSKVIRLMGDKIESKKIAEKAGLRTIPGYFGSVTHEDECIEIARDLGYPVILKASAGGGGKAMRVARSDQEIREGFKLSVQEAKSSFGDDRMLVEKFLENPRHIEIQILGDKHGNIIHLNERECSIQRRNQKVIEEAPSAFLSEQMRIAMGEQAVKLCQSLNYSSAGTVEFLVDQNYNFYFLEMNTRLQVEHAVTELITGIDLVEQMIRIAKGYRLEIKQNDVKLNGWAIESRIYAEDCYKKFGLPSTGRLFKYVEPQNGRCDSGVEEGSEISIYYDSLISKLICHRENRDEAIKHSVESLDSYVIRGVSHNIALLRDIFTERQFKEGKLGTNYLTQTYPDGFKGRKLDARSQQNLVSIAAVLYFLNQLKPVKTSQMVIRLNDERITYDVTVCNNSEDHFIIKLLNVNKTHKISKRNLKFPQFLIKTEIDGVKETFQFVSKNANGEFQLIYQGTCYKLNILSKQAANLVHLMPCKPKLNVSKLIKTPMPGLVRNVNCRVGDEVIEGQELCTIEAMKMQNSMRTPTKGKIKSILIQKGGTVAKDDVLIELE